METEIHNSQYTALADLHYRIRRFLRGGDDAAHPPASNRNNTKCFFQFANSPTTTTPLSAAWRNACSSGITAPWAWSIAWRRTATSRRVRSTHDQRESGHALVSALAAILKHSNSRNRRKAANSQQRKGELKPKHRSTRAQTPNARQSESRCAQPGNMRGLCYLVH